jgi:hypothetical protein
MNIIALTQFAFVALGFVTLKILIHARSDYLTSSYLQTLDGLSYWLFAIPLAWMAFALLCTRVDRGPLVPRVAYGSGIVIAVLCCLFLIASTVLPFL